MSAAPIAIAPAQVGDPLMTSVALPHRAEFCLYGFPVVVASNSARVLSAARESWPEFEKRFAVAPLEIRFLVSEGTTPECPPLPKIRAQGNLAVWVADMDNYWCCDLTGGFATAWVTGRAVANASYFRYQVLEAMAYTLLECRHVVSVHAACVAFRGHGVLLAGESGAGKSSLAYACARRGWTFISDDASRLLRHSRERRVLGDPRLCRFRATAGTLFPEFGGMRESRRTGGKPTIEVRTESLPAIRTAWEAHVDSIVFLNRRDGRSGRTELSRLSRRDALDLLEWSPWPGELASEKERRAHLERLLGAAIYEMRYRDLDAAVDALQQITGGDRS